MKPLTVLIMLAVCSVGAAQERTIWHDPGAIARINFSHAAGPEGPPRAPFQFVEERLSGNAPKVSVRDAAGIEWRVKWGLEVRAESFATRFMGALGYYVAPTWFIARGKIVGVRSLTRAARFIRRDGSFSNASFERKDASLNSLREDWAWNRNPFVGTNQLNGLKVLVMLLANWDNKDSRDATLGSNTAIVARRRGGQEQWIYTVTDWGQALGGWGPRLNPRTWNCERFTAQTQTFVRGRHGNRVGFGFMGQHTADFANDITVESVRWLMHYLGRITDAQIRSGLKASGATPDETTCFTTQLRARIKQLARVSSQ